jgi:hypothetical protein
VTKPNGNGEHKTMTDAELAEQQRRQQEEAEKARARYNAVHSEVQRVVNHYSRLPRRKNA